MQIIPAIDLIDGCCVRLTKGDYARQTTYDSDPVAVAKRLELSGFTRLHLVDLDGARTGRICNQSVLRDIAAATDLIIDYGGGIKTERELQTVLDCGAKMVTIGSLAVKEGAMFESWIARYGAERFILGADARDGKVSVSGWREDSETYLMPFIEHYMDMGLQQVLCTDIHRDGMMSGPAIDLYRDIMGIRPDCHLIASGGVSCIEDVVALKEAGVPAVVIGKAIYEGKIKLEQLCSLNE